jgi:secondary thiamine-phosphate synthase enzyme
MSFFTESIKTNHQTGMIEITERIQSLISQSGVIEGLCMIYSPHTTAGITINENADPDVQRDMISEINKIVPFSDQYHHSEGNSAAHIKTTFTGLHAMLPIHKGLLVLGTWQGIYFCEFDGPRNRNFHVQILKGIQ